MSWRDVGFLVIGLFVGANVGLLVLALCVAARRGDDMMKDGIETGDRGREMGDGEENGEGRKTGMDDHLEFFDGRWWLKVPNRKIVTKTTKRKDGIFLHEISFSDEPLIPPGGPANAVNEENE